MNNPVLQYVDVTLGYGQDDVVSHVNLTIDRGVLLPFVGPNGAGKSTMFKSMLGFLSPKHGVIHHDFGGKRPGYVPQQQVLDAIFPVSVRQIVAMGLYPETGLLGWLSKELEQRLDSILEQFNLTEHQRKTFGELSGGLKQKTLIARALVGGADVIFLDEPMAGLDAASEEMVLSLLLELNQKQQKTILMAHHRLEDLSRLAAQVCLVNQHQAVFCPSEEAWKRLNGGTLK